MRTALLILGGLSLIVLGIVGIAKRSLTFGFFAPLDTQQHRGTGAIIMGVVLILIGIGVIVGEIVMLARA
jgi:hypothetical protein